MQSTVGGPTHTNSGTRALVLDRKTTLTGTLESVTVARRWATAILTAWGIHETAVIELIVSELATNAVVHTTSGLGGYYTLHVAVSSNRIRVDVRDAGPLPGRTPARVHVDPEATSGRGLALVGTFANWGTLTDGVWAEIAR